MASLTFPNGRTADFDFDWEQDPLFCGTETPERLVEHIMYICAFGEPRATLFRFIKESSGAVPSPKEQADMVFRDIDALGTDTILKWMYEYDSVEYAKTW